MLQLFYLNCRQFRYWVEIFILILFFKICDSIPTCCSYVCEYKTACCLEAKKIGRLAAAL